VCFVSGKGSTIFRKNKCPKFSKNTNPEAQSSSLYQTLVCDTPHKEEGTGTPRSPGFHLGLLIGKNQLLEKLFNLKCSFAVD